MQKIARLCLTLLLLLLSTASLSAQTNTALSPEKSEKILGLVRAAMAEGKIPSVSLAIVSDNQLRLAAGLGTADLENSVPAKPNTVFRLGSLSKTMTATAVMLLAEAGKLDLDAPIQKYCPAFLLKQWPVTARQLLAHLGGVRDYNNQKFLEEYFSTHHYESVAESLGIFKNDPLVQEPGTKFTYSTYGYNVLGCAIEGASQTTYESYVRDNIWKPAGMTRTGVDDVFQVIQDRARGYGKTRGGIVRNTAFADTSNKIPAGGLISTAEDMARFYMALQNGRLVSSQTLEQMWTPQRTRDGQPVPYGLGWRIGERNGLKEVFHGGAAAGFSTFLYILPARKVAIVLMVNLEQLGQPQRDDLARQIADVVIE